MPPPRDVYVFRHCVRSTSLTVKHAGMGTFKSAADFTDLPLPSWGTPENWCTEGGESMVEGTGGQLAGWLAAQGITNVTIYADPVLRDADTAMAFLKGLGGVGSIQFDPHLFDTLDPEVGSPLCVAGFDDTQLAAAVTARLTSVPMPSSVASAEVLVMELAGVGRAGNLSDAAPLRVVSSGALEGSTNVIKRFAQQVFYSFASGAAYPLHRQPSTAEMYMLIAWQHWSRSVSRSFNPKYATVNAGLVHAVLSTLESPTATAALFIGHDGNLDGMATLLDLQWEAPPYFGGPTLIPTPPGSALRFRIEDGASGDRGARVEVSFVYPVFTTAGDARNASGLLESVPILSETLDELSARAHAGLRRYPGAYACYERAVARWPPPQGTAAPASAGLEAGYFLSAVLGALLALVLLVGFRAGVCYSLRDLAKGKRLIERSGLPAEVTIT